MLPYHRRRATSYHPARNSPLATSLGLPTVSLPLVAHANGADGGVGAGTARNRLASLASSWGVPFGRKRLNGSSSSGLRTPGTESKDAVSQERIAETDS